MLFISKLLLFVHSVTNGFGSFNPPMQFLTDGNKYGFIRDPEPNMAKMYKAVEVQDDVNVQTRWPNGIVRYYVDYKSYDENIDTEIIRATELIEKRSCIKFVKLNTEPDDNKTWIHITNPSKERECVHMPKYMDSGEIVLPLGYDCLKFKEILHTLLHGIGIKDEVTHPDRGKYIRVMWDNIQPDYHHLYHKQAVKLSNSRVEYDPLSVMQFHDRAFSKNGRATIATLVPGLLISPSETLSQLDQMRLQVYFGHECNKRKVSTLLNSCRNSLLEAQDHKDGEKFGNNGQQDVINDDTDYNAENEEKRIESAESKLKESENENNVDSTNEEKMEEDENDKEEVEVATKDLNMGTEEKPDDRKLISVKKKLTESPYEKNARSARRENYVKLANVTQVDLIIKGRQKNSNEPRKGTLQFVKKQSIGHSKEPKDKDNDVNLSKN